MPLAIGVLDGYTLTMSDVLEYIRRRRAELRMELQELDIAERIYQQSREEGEPATAPPSPITAAAAQWKMTDTNRPKTIKGMVLQVLDEIYPDGLTALEILDQIKVRWKADLERTTLSPQLTRLKKKDKSIKNEMGKWFLVVENQPHFSLEAKNDAPPEETDGAP